MGRAGLIGGLLTTWLVAVGVPWLRSDQPGDKGTGGRLHRRYQDLGKATRVKLIDVWGAPEQEVTWANTTLLTPDGKFALSATGGGIIDAKAQDSYVSLW